MTFILTFIHNILPKMVKITPAITGRYWVDFYTQGALDRTMTVTEENIADVTMEILDGGYYVAPINDYQERVVAHHFTDTVLAEEVYGG